MADSSIKETLARIEKGGAPKYHQKNAEQGKAFARERIAKLAGIADSNPVMPQLMRKFACVA